MAIGSSKLSGIGPTVLGDALALGYKPVIAAALFSLISNLLYLSLPVYTNQIYSRILPSESISSLTVLTIGIAIVFLFSTVIDYCRDQLLRNFGRAFDQRVASQLFEALFDSAVRIQGTRAQALRDLDQVRQVIAGSALGAIFDLPWLPLFLLILFIVDPLIGTLTLFAGVMLVIFAFLQERATHKSLKTSAEAAIQSYGFTDAALRNGEVVRALGMLPRLGKEWSKNRAVSISAGSKAIESAAFFSGAIRYVRMLTQIMVIALGAYLVVDRKIPSSLLFANMILASRALAPLERVVNSWKGLFDALQAYRRIGKALANYQPPVRTTQLPVPSGSVLFQKVNFSPSGAPALVLTMLSFEVLPGEFLGIIGPSGAGKSTLARLLVGIWKPNSGHVRLDGADVFTWDRADFGRWVAYQPQDTGLFRGTARDNIARFQSDAKDADVVSAAQAAGVHDLILSLPKGYETELGEGGAMLAAGQRQRLGLARTLFGDPKLVVLDEPNANLDQEGEVALQNALLMLKRRGATIVLISHKPSMLQYADKLLVLRAGKIDFYGPRDDVLRTLTGGGSQPNLRADRPEAKS